MTRTQTHKNAAEKTPEPGTASWWNRSTLNLGRVEYWMFVISLLCMALTIVTTFPLWQSRIAPPNLPLAGGLSGISFGYLLLGSLIFAMIVPRMGTLIHIAILMIAISFDVIRCQPQVFALPLLMAACVWRPVRPVCHWYLIAMWLWAGIHKVLSPYWMGPSSWALLDKMGFETAIEWHLYFAWFVALFEIALGLLAIFRPRMAAPFCVVLHFGIIGMLLSMNWNFSVLYWNFATAIVGGWILWTSVQAKTRGSKSTLSQYRQVWPRELWQGAIALVLLISPLGVYNGITPHFLGHVLYSDHMPRAVVSNAHGAELVTTWDSLNVPITRVRAILRQYFAAVAKPGDKCHILDSRAGMDEIYLVADVQGRVSETNSINFYNNQAAVQGVANDYEPAVFELQKAKVRMLKRTKKGMIYAVEFYPQNYSLRLVELLKHLPNLEQIQFAGCAVQDEHLKELVDLPVLTGIGLSNTLVTDGSAKYLSEMFRLKHIQFDATDLSDQAVSDSLRGH